MPLHNPRPGDIFIPKRPLLGDPFLIIKVAGNEADWRYLFSADTKIRTNWHWQRYEWDEAKFVTNVLDSDYWRKWIKDYKEQHK